MMRRSRLLLTGATLLVTIAVAVFVMLAAWQHRKHRLGPTLVVNSADATEECTNGVSTINFPGPPCMMGGSPGFFPAWVNIPCDDTPEYGVGSMCCYTDGDNYACGAFPGDPEDFLPPDKYCSCPESEQCHDDCAGCAGNPVTLTETHDPRGAGKLNDEFSLFDMGDGGFPPTFSVFFRGRDTGLQSHKGLPLGLNVTHTFSIFLWKAVGASPEKLRARIEDGRIIPFEYTGTEWAPEDGRRVSLVEDTGGSCAGNMTLTLEDGTVYTYQRFCDGTDTDEGRILRIDRPNGDFLDFDLTENEGVDGHVVRVENRYGEAVTFGFLGDEPLTGQLISVTSPTGDTFDFTTASGGTLDTITGPSSASVWDLDIDTGSSNYGALLAVHDGNDHIDHEWTYDSSGAVATEEGPYADESNPGDDTLLTFVYSSGETTVTFNPADTSVSSATNTYTWATESQQLSRVTDRDIQGGFPKSGAFSFHRQYWSGTTDVAIRWAPDLSATVYQDVTSLGGEHRPEPTRGDPQRGVLRRAPVGGDRGVRR